MNDNSAKRELNFNSVAAILFAGLGIALFFLVPYEIDKPLIRIGVQSDLSPELFPRLVSVAFFGLGVWFFLQSRRLRQRNELRDLDREAMTNVVVTLVIMAGYVYVMINLGFVVGSFLMIMVMSTYFGNRDYWLGAGVALVIPVVVFVLFTKVLITSLPPFPVDDVISAGSFLYAPLKYLSNHSIL